MRKRGRRETRESEVEKKEGERGDRGGREEKESRPPYIPLIFFCTSQWSRLVFGSSKHGACLWDAQQTTQNKLSILVVKSMINDENFQEVLYRVID